MLQEKKGTLWNMRQGCSTDSSTSHQHCDVSLKESRLEAMILKWVTQTCYTIWRNKNQVLHYINCWLTTFQIWKIPPTGLGEQPSFSILTKKCFFTFILQNNFSSNMFQFLNSFTILSRSLSLIHIVFRVWVVVTEKIAQVEFLSFYVTP